MRAIMIPLPENKKVKIHEKINEIKDIVARAQGSGQPVSARTTALYDLLPVFQAQLENSEMEEALFNSFRKRLLENLNGRDKVTETSQRLWSILSLMAKIHPITTVDIIDMSTPVPRGQDEPGTEWFYASTGHAYLLRHLVQCQHQGKFINACLGAGTFFNHHDQKMIRHLAAENRINIPDPTAQTEQFLRDLYQRYLIHTTLFFQNASREIPSLLEEIKKDVMNRGLFHGWRSFLEAEWEALRENKPRSVKIAVFIILLSKPFGWDGLKRSVVWGMLIYELGALCFGEKNIIKNFILHLDFFFKITLGACFALNFSINRTLAKLAQNSPFPIAVLDNVLHRLPRRAQWIVNMTTYFLMQLARILPRKQFVLTLNSISMRAFLFVTNLIFERILLEGKHFSRTSIEARVDELFRNGGELATNILEDLQQRDTDLEEYFLHLSQQFWGAGGQRMLTEQLPALIQRYLPASWQPPVQMAIRGVTDGRNFWLQEAARHAATPDAEVDPMEVQQRFMEFQQRMLQQYQAEAARAAQIAPTGPGL